MEYHCSVSQHTYYVLQNRHSKLDTHILYKKDINIFAAFDDTYDKHTAPCKI